MVAAMDADPAFERELRRRQRDVEAEEVEYDWVGSTLEDALVELAERGDTVRLAAVGRAWTGVLVHVGEDFATISPAPEVEIDMTLGRLESVRVVASSRGVGRKGQRHPRRFEARLRELAVSAREVELSVGDGLSGRIVAVAVDHARFEALDGATWLVPLAGLAWVARRV